MRASIATLIAEQITYDSIGQSVKHEIPREVMVDVASITRGEWYAAGKLGMNPQVKLVTPVCNYNGEVKVDFEGVRYDIYRTYTDSDRIELYLERTVNE